MALLPARYTTGGSAQSRGDLLLGQAGGFALGGDVCSDDPREMGGSLGCQSAVGLPQMTGTQQAISQVVATTRESAAKFALQMAQQSRKFGARVAELRIERGWKQRDLVAEMERLGDQSLNTNQLSRYENGGAMPGEQRQEWFAEALGTTVADLHRGSATQRRSNGDTPDVMAELDGNQLDRIEKKLDDALDRLEAIDAEQIVDDAADQEEQQNGESAAEADR